MSLIPGTPESAPNPSEEASVLDEVVAQALLRDMGYSSGGNPDQYVERGQVSEPVVIETEKP